MGLSDGESRSCPHAGGAAAVFPRLPVGLEWSVCGWRSVEIRAGSEGISGLLQRNHEHGRRGTVVGLDQEKGNYDVRMFPNSKYIFEHNTYAIMKLTSDFLMTSTTHLTAFIARALTDVHVRLSRFSPAVVKSNPLCQCRCQRVTRCGWMDHAMSWLGWYPWQCIDCHTCFYFRRRY